MKNIDLFSLSPQVIAEFISFCVKEKDVTNVASLTEAIYAKTMGIIPYVKHALEELVRKNVLF